MIKLAKCCFVFPLRPGCVAIGVVFIVLSLLGAINKLVQICLFAQTLEDQQKVGEESIIDGKIHAGIIRFSFVLVIEVIICCSAVSFIYGIFRERLRFMPPFIVHLSLKVGYYAVHYFNVGTRHIERKDVKGGLVIYSFGIVICTVFTYLWLCAYSAFIEMKATKDARSVIREGIMQREILL